MTDLHHKTKIVRLLEDNKCARKSLTQLSTQVHNLIKRVEILEKSEVVSLKRPREVDIDPSGVFKYVLIQCDDNFLVRGFKWAEYHADIYDEVEVELHQQGVNVCKCVGGGRIDHDNNNKRIIVYGYSVGFGRADHATTVHLLLKEFPDYDITFSNDGY